jgi:hypothetical protein
LFTFNHYRCLPLEDESLSKQLILLDDLRQEEWIMEDRRLEFVLRMGELSRLADRRRLRLPKPLPIIIIIILLLIVMQELVKELCWISMAGWSWCFLASLLRRP